MAIESNCPNCGAPLDLKNPESAKMAYCSYCSSEIDLGTNEAKKLDLIQKPKPAKSALELGLEGEINGIKYQIVGRIRYRDPKTYSWWDEWLLLSENGQYLWLSEEDWEFVLMHKYTPEVPYDPNSVEEYLTIDGEQLEVEDKSRAVVMFFEGELTWKAKSGETVNYLDAWKDDTHLFSCEWTDREILYFRGIEIPAEKIYQAFKLGPLPPEATGEGLTTEGPLQKLAQRLISGPMLKLSIIFSILLVVTGIFLSFLGKDVKSLKNNKKATDKVVYFGPYKMDKKGSIYAIKTRVSGLSNEEVYVEFDILNENEKPVAYFDGDYYHYEGYDSDGHWEESSLSKTRSFVLREPGKYLIKANFEKKLSGNNKLKVTVREGIFHTTPLFVLAGILMLYPFLVLGVWIISGAGAREEV